MDANLPKIIWMYWHQGRQQLPFLVQQCLASWEKNNSDWEIKLVDETSLPGYLPDLRPLTTREDIGLQALTDIFRVQLLLKYGGVWADATLFCNRPLDTWLPQYLQDNFFCFSSERTDRVMTTWFLAGTEKSKTLTNWHEEMLWYWNNHKFRRQTYWSRQILRKLTSLRKRGLVTNDIWFSSAVLSFFRVYPYPINMYLFERALDFQPHIKHMWQQRKTLNDTQPEYLQNILGMNEALSGTSRKFIDAAAPPVHKLNWRQDLGHAVKGSNLEYLLARSSGD